MSQSLVSSRFTICIYLFPWLVRDYRQVHSLFVGKLRGVLGHYVVLYRGTSSF